VSTRPAGSQSRFRRGIAIATGLVVIGGLAVSASAAGASPQPTVAQVQAKVNQLTTQYDKVTEQLDQVGEQLSADSSELASIAALVDATDLPIEDRSTAAFALGKALDDAGRHQIAQPQRLARRQRTVSLADAVCPRRARMCLGPDGAGAVPRRWLPLLCEPELEGRALRDNKRGR